MRHNVQYRAWKTSEETMEDKLTPQERYLVLWIFKQKRLQNEDGKYDALNESAMKSMFERLFFGTYKCLATLKGHTNEVYSLTHYSNKRGNKLFSGGDDKTIRVWNADTHEHLATLEGHTGHVNCLTIYGNKLFTGSWDKAIRVWNADTHVHLATLEGPTHHVWCLTLYGNKLFSGSYDGTIRVWKSIEED